MKRGLGLITLLAALSTGAPIAEGAWATRTLGGTTVHVFTPATPRGPLMFALHGCTQSAAAIRDAGWDDVAERHGAVVAVPDVPNGGVLAGCWDYYGQNHTRTNHHNGAVLDIVSSLIADGALAIDPDRVYIAGLSSGAGQAFVLGCLAPDVFAGVGINAGPAVGTEASEASFVRTNAAATAAVCRRFAGANADAFDTQLASIIYGDGDFIVSRNYGPLNADALSMLYDAPTTADIDVSALPGYEPSGTGRTWSDATGPRISMIEVDGMGHAFPAGTGAGPELSFVASEGPSWPTYLFDFFAANDRRSGATPPPRDGGSTTPDPDGGSTNPEVDGGTNPGADGGSTMPGADAGASSGGSTDASGCTCMRRPSNASWLALAFALLIVVRRRAV